MDRLYVIWREPTEAGTRHIVGELTRVSDGFHFAYQPEHVGVAKERGFVDVPGFPYATDDPEEVFKSGYLFPFFVERIPSPRREDYLDLLSSWGVESKDDLLEILAKSGGVSATDRFELAEYRDEQDDLERPLEFRVAGARHRPQAANLLTQGDEVLFQRERDNPVDPDATMVVTTQRTHIGYVPRQYASLLARHLQIRSQLRAVAVRKLLLPEETIGSWVVRVQRI